MVKMATSGQICKMSYTAYCKTLFALLFHSYKLRYFYTMWHYKDVGKPPEKKKD